MIKFLRIFKTSKRDKLGRALYDACQYAQKAEAKRLIADGAPVDWQKRGGMAPLHWASFHKTLEHTKIVMLLLRNKCNINITDKKGNTPLIIAADNNNMGTVRALVEAGCDITIRNKKGKTAAEIAKKNGKHAIAEYLTNEAPRVQVQARLRAERDPKARDRDWLGEQLLNACACGMTREVKWLIAEGAPVDWQDEDGKAPLHGASINGNTEIVMLLLENKCDVNITNKLGDTPLTEAAYYNKMGKVRALVEAGCDITIRNKKGKTAAEIAKENGNHDIAEYLTKEAPRVREKAESAPDALNESGYKPA